MEKREVPFQSNKPLERFIMLLAEHMSNRYPPPPAAVSRARKFAQAAADVGTSLSENGKPYFGPGDLIVDPCAYMKPKHQRRFPQQSGIKSLEENEDG